MDYFEEYERLIDDLQLFVGDGGQSFNFEVGDIVLEIDNSNTDIADITNISDAADITNITDTADITDNSQSFDYGDSAVFAPVFDSSEIVNNYNSGSESRGGRVTVNFNAYNRIDSSGADIDAVIDAFGERLAGIIASAAEGVHL